MKVLSLLLVFVLLTSGCNKQNDAIDKILSVRSRLNESGCEFYTTIVADYGEYTLTFDLACCTNELGELMFTVRSPESINGISGVFDAEGGKLRFDDHVLAFSPLSEGLLTPVAAPWVLYSAIKGGYINSGGSVDNGYTIQIDDTYRDASLLVDITTDKNGIPCAAELYWEGCRIIWMQIDKFQIL